MSRLFPSERPATQRPSKDDLAISSLTGRSGAPQPTPANDTRHVPNADAGKQK
jgi:hypothetical protein